MPWLTVTVRSHTITVPHDTVTLSALTVTLLYCIKMYIGHLFRLPNFGQIFSFMVPLELWQFEPFSEFVVPLSWHKGHHPAPMGKGHLTEIGHAINGI